MRRRGATALAAALVAVLAACSSSNPVSGTTGGSAGTRAAWVDYNPDPTYPGTVTMANQSITMPDGIKLSATVTLPADASGKAVDHPVPTILTMTGYNKGVGDYVAVLGGANAYLVSHGYAHVVVDVRGTGSSQGQWEAFGETEQGDYTPTMDWVAAQPWCNGRVGLYGASLLAITAVLAAEQQHPSLKALFPIVPMADSYRDIVFTGGQVNVGFIPLWLGLVTGLSAIDFNAINDPAGALQNQLEHLLSAVTNFQVPTILQAVAGDPSKAYDGPFWRVRSPIEKAAKIQVPTFIVGGLHDIFQRGEPQLYDALKGHVTAKLLIGPWTHVDAATGAGLPVDGVPVLDHIALQWFDQYVKGMNVGADRLPNVTQYVYGQGHFQTASDWPHPQASAQTLYLHGDQSLSTAAPAAGEASNLVLQEPLNGICSSSTSQWTAGALGLLPLPCFSDDTLAETLEVKYDTAPMAADYYFNGPIQADLWISTTAADAGVTVRVNDVDGSTVLPLTNGILTASMRALD